MGNISFLVVFGVFFLKIFFLRMLRPLFGAEHKLLLIRPQMSFCQNLIEYHDYDENNSFTRLASNTPNFFKVKVFTKLSRILIYICNLV